jgi:hypothetical protein
LTARAGVSPAAGTLQCHRKATIGNKTEAR